MLSSHDLHLTPPIEGNPVPPVCLTGGAYGRGPPMQAARRLAVEYPDALKREENVMQTFINFWTSHVPHTPNAAIGFVQAYAKVMVYPPGTYLARAGDYWPYWNFVLEGAVMAMRYDEDGSVVVPWLVTKGGYFTGTVHAFTERHDEVFIRALDDTRVVLLPNYRLQEAQQLYHAFSELINILKQRRLEQDAVFDSLFRQPTGEARLMAFFDAYPRLAPQLPIQQVCAILQISSSTYQRAKQQYYRKR
ncbi:hypothetical protein GCM10011386_39270 [Parapedobacter defluvii]|uniref:Cyclic nucleotide-binding domain-containing protein n=1 Tax=Parapedobacter defluvii TaxID=2045106 RepID=A0ABQ1MM86_9SPHI|nr:cyclic nucleotide-binding domain-containing protein [Parapedobacter defluvii]GGC43151.1 hypothetical protein GCM10011386_39270 [Parapedobacter defluvii]